jgi:hypothetical protein
MSLKHSARAALLATGAALAAPADAATLDVFPAFQSGVAFTTSPGVPVPLATFFVNTADLRALGAIRSLSATFTIFDLDTGRGEFDAGNVRLLLNGIDTGVLLDGFQGSDPNRTDLVTRTVTGNVANGEAILASILASAGGTTLGRISAAFVSTSVNNAGFVPLQDDIVATLTLGSDPVGGGPGVVPVPVGGAAPLLAVGLIGLAAAVRRRGPASGG